MPTPIPLTITDAGMDALVEAQASATVRIRVDKVGLTERAFTVAGTLTALPDEFKQLDSVSGQATAPNVIHMTAQDSDAVTYDLRGLGLYLEDGTLFAVYAQDEPIFRKVSSAAFLLAFDILFDSAIAEDIDFGEAVFLYPPASETVIGVAELATAAEVAAGVDDARIVTPAKLKGALDAVRTRKVETAGLLTGGGTLQQDLALGVAAATNAETVAGALTDKAVTPAGVGAAFAGRRISAAGLATGGGTLAADRTITVTAATNAEAVAGVSTTTAITPASLKAVVGDILTRKILTAGLATGGGDLSADRTITVAAASQAQVEAGIANDVAVTPAALGAIGMLVDDAVKWMVRLPGGIMIQGSYGPADVDGAPATARVLWRQPFPTKCLGVIVGTVLQGAGAETGVTFAALNDHDQTGCSVKRVGTTGGASGARPLLLAVGF